MSSLPVRSCVVVSLICLAFALTACDDVPTPKVDTPTTPAAAPAPAPTAADRQGWPTEAQAKAAIFKVEYDIRASQTNKDVWKVKDLRHEVKSVTFAPRTLQKQMNYGAQAITVYPAKILYTRITEYQHKEPTREEAGHDGVWFLYQDSFGQWTAKYGSE